MTMLQHIVLNLMQVNVSIKYLVTMKLTYIQSSLMMWSFLLVPGKNT